MRHAFALSILLIAACRTAQNPAANDTVVDVPQAALAALDSADVRRHVEYLSGDRLEGRGSGTRGEQLAVEYIAEEMRQAGLQPAGDNGTFFQAVPLLGSTPKPRGPLVLTHRNGQAVSLDFVEDFIVSTDLESTGVETEGQLVFVGYGIDAPGHTWHDFKDVDVRDKILVAFVNDPQATAAEPALFQADTLTYYGRWTYKYEEARRRGAAGMLLIHTTPTASYPFTVLSGTAASEQIQLATPPENPLEMKGWITEESADALARMAGSSLEEWFRMANRRDFQPQPLPVTASVDVDYAVRRFSGQNVIGMLPGRTRPEEAIVYTAHHDHLGIGAPVDGDSIYNGAVDNATGTAMMLELAEAFSSLPQRPERSVLFVTLTAEEHGLLGAEHYARNPAVPLPQTFANINVDSGNINGRTRDIVGIGAERSDLLPLLRRAAAAEGLTVSPDARPNAGIFFRSDQLAFARGGVPAVYLTSGRSFVGQPEDYYMRVNDDYTAHRYHGPNDEINPTWRLGGLLQQLRVAFRLGYRLANTSLEPQWRPGEAFAGARN